MPINPAHSIDRSSASYIEAVVKKKSQDDPKEVAIRSKIEKGVLREEWARDAFSRVKTLQIEFMKDAVAHATEGAYVHEKVQNALREISRTLRAEIVEGAEYLQDLPKGTPTIIATNHFGAYKLAGINPRTDLGIDIPNYDAMYPYPLYFAALSPVADALGDNLYYVSEDFPLVFGQIHSAAGFIHVPPAAIEIPGGRTAFLEKQTGDAIRQHPNAAIVNFPEGGTSGKYTGMGPYDLDPFKTGGYVIAAKLGIHITPVAQYFDKDKGFQLKVLRPFIPQATDKAGFERYAESNRMEMQQWFDGRKDR